MFHHIGNLTLNPDILKTADIKVGNNSVTQSGLGGTVNFETKNAKDLLEYGQQFGGRVQREVPILWLANDFCRRRGVSGSLFCWQVHMCWLILHSQLG